MFICQWKVIHFDNQIWGKLGVFLYLYVNKDMDHPAR